MIVKILSPSASFAAVRYNTDKVDRGMGELMVARNFRAMDALSDIRPQDYINYLKHLAAGNSRIAKPQFHAVISADGKSTSAQELSVLAERWLEKMGYGKNPYLIVFHGDTDNHHVHLVSCRVNREGKKISSGFERIRAVAALNALQGIDPEVVCKKDISSALAYQFSTLAQFKLLLESSGYDLREAEGKLELFRYGRVLGKVDLNLIHSRFMAFDKKRANQLRQIFLKYLPVHFPRLIPVPISDYRSVAPIRYTSDFAAFASEKLGFELVFHSAKGKLPYGYTIIDHAGQRVFKGAEVMPLKDMLAAGVSQESTELNRVDHIIDQLIGKQDTGNFDPGNGDERSGELAAAETGADDMGLLELRDDIDDEAILGRNRARKGMARTNTR
ncbi:relaxase/mobilization nuclease domain-containing protein [Pedobacter agri]|uniref:Relaxase/mobilization nuclease domain-containing protein n=1 Tax=Pedobacter agri TaxID=454586 RepID=A0A9X3DD45_9SPHI|nr:relaxase/mobilization nuclease domain-containing protein [Pedobacter agri]MCX3264980.1 relaxase/mobilization nuclease domain-containing protein [Pedobacter agri]